MENTSSPPERLPENDAFIYSWMFDEDIEALLTLPEIKKEDAEKD